MRARCRIALAAILVCAAAAAPARAEGLKPGLPGPSLVTPILVDSVNEESAWVFPSDDPSRFYIEARPLLEVTAKYLPDSSQKKLEAYVTPQGVISLSALKVLGMAAKLDEQTLDLNLSIPPKIRKPGEVPLVGVTSTGERIIGPAPFSGYVNAIASDSYSYPAQNNLVTPGQGRLPLASSLQSVQNLDGWALGYGANYTESQTSPWQRQATNLVRDDVDDMLRGELGDQVIQTQGFQSALPIAGLSVVRNFAIQPYRTTRPINRTSIFLNRPSTVEVYVNGAFVTRLQLPAGPVDLKDFPLVSGQNDLTVKVTDDLGQTETIHLSMLYDNQLLSPGLNQYGYTIGFPSTVTQSGYAYDSSNFEFAGFQRLGVSDVLTLGANVQHDENGNLFGGQQVWTTFLGTFATDMALSQSAGLPVGFGWHTQYRSPENMPGGPSGLLIVANTEYYSPNFTTVGQLGPYNTYGWAQDLYASQAIFGGQGRVGAGPRYEWGTNGNPDESILQGDLSWNWTRNFQTAVNYSVTRLSGGGNPVSIQNRALFTLTWTDDPGTTQVYGTADTEASTERVELHRQPDQPYNDMILSGGVQNSPDQQEGDLQAQYLGNHGTIQLNQQSVNSDPGAAAIGQQPGLSNTTGLTLGVAVAWAGSNIGITRPINDSFAIVNDVNGTGIGIPVNNNGSYSEGYVNGFGPAIIPDLLSYYDRPVHLDTSNLPDGYVATNEYQIARPSYHSGVAIPLRIQAFVTAKGVMLDELGKPVALASGEVYPLGGSKPVGEAFFTNARGVFYVEGLKPGKYEIRVYESDLLPVPFEIAAGSTGVASVGTVIAHAKGETQ